MAQHIATNREKLAEFVDGVRDVGYRDDKGLLVSEAYGLAVDFFPLLCVDLIPVKETDAGPAIGVIERRGGSEGGYLAILGGLVKKDERREAAIQRHLTESLGAGLEYGFLAGNDAAHPFYVSD